MRKRPHDDFLNATLPTLDLVFNLARRLVDARDVDDLVQETFTRALAAWTRGRRPRKVQAWMATICLNTGRSWLRRATVRREVSADIGIEVPSSDDVAGEAVGRLRRDAVRRALAELPEEQGIAITLMDLDGFTASETARIIGSPRGTVLSRVHRGRKKLARILREELDPLEA